MSKAALQGKPHHLSAKTATNIGYFTNPNINCSQIILALSPVVNLISCSVNDLRKTIGKHSTSAINCSRQYGWFLNSVCQPQSPVPFAAEIWGALSHRQSKARSLGLGGRSYAVGLSSIPLSLLVCVASGLWCEDNGVVEHGVKATGLDKVDYR